jgi:hypothetical protein
MNQLTGATSSSTLSQLPVRDLQSWRGIDTPEIMAYLSQRGWIAASAYTTGRYTKTMLIA